MCRARTPLCVENKKTQRMNKRIKHSETTITTRRQMHAVMQRAIPKGRTHGDFEFESAHPLRAEHDAKTDGSGG